MSKPALSIIVPAFNEAVRIASTLEAMRQYLEGASWDYEILVAADGDDGTREIVSAMVQKDRRLSVFGTPERRGKGLGIREGVARARGEVIGFVDADYKTPIEEMEKLLPWLDRGVDVVIGSRAMADSRVEVPQPFYRRIGSRGFGVFMHLTVGLWGIRDTQCGFKFFRGDVARDLFSRQRVDGYMFDVELLYLAARSRYRVKEVGIRWHDDGDSRLELLAGNWRNLRDVLQIRLNRYAPRGPAQSLADVSARGETSV
jgi:dolichyl-phosphate beta-glucosyltransferase